MLPKHTPYANSSKPLEIGLRPLDLSYWIEPDEHLPRYLNEKRRLLSEIPERVFVSELDSGDVQSEVLELLLQHLLENHSDQWSKQDGKVHVAGHEVDLADDKTPDLVKASLMVQEDLVTMRKADDGWRIAAACVCFPSSWVLIEKVGKPLHDIHAPVPGFAKGTRNAIMIERIFDNLPVDQPVERFNWSVYKDDILYHDDSWRDHFPDAEAVNQNNYFLRIERQTLRKLPVTGDILFTVRIHIDPIETLSRREDRAELIPGFIKSIEALPEDVMIYKGFDGGRDLLIERLEGMLD
ncbi:MAG: DUF3445 domain-containing protein [Pseudomonadota bacterium]